MIPCFEGLGAIEGGAGAICQMDADFSHDPADLPRLLAAISAGADVALGSRYVAGGGVEDWGLLRRVVSELLVPAPHSNTIASGVRVHTNTGHKRERDVTPEMRKSRLPS